METSTGIKPVIIRSLIFPGWGQLYNNNKLKGWILTSLGAITISSAVYFIIDSNNKQKKYLNDVNLSTIQNNYNEYNTSYKLKNISIISFIAVWVYSQIDILFFSQNNSLPLTQLKTNFMNQFQLNFSFSF
jgi:TM2 domain-containing membrane protein YozV